MAELGRILATHVQEMRDDPEQRGPQGKVLIEAVLDGKQLNDEEMLHYLFNMMVVGAETTPMAVGGAFYYLDKHPEQKAMLLKDRGLAMKVYRETLRYDQPTNMLVRRAAMDFELNGAEISEGDNLMFIYAAANRDERRFPDADSFDINRKNDGDLSFGAGAHYCLGAPLALLAGQLMMREILDAIEDYEIVEEGCKRSFGEYIQGFTEVRIRLKWK